MLYVKIMSGQDLPDENPYKHYELIQVKDNESIRFDNNDGDEAASGHHFIMRITNPDGGTSEFLLEGNVYIMSENGKTIASHGC